jgi:hypothetical protein
LLQVLKSSGSTPTDTITRLPSAAAPDNKLSERSLISH